MTSRPLFICLLTSAALLAPMADTATGQQNQPIYSAYDGYVKNPDGSFTVAYAYFSHNSEVVTIPPGPNNAFSVEPGDRMQPTTFKPGHWRFQCVMVVGPKPRPSCGLPKLG